MLKPVALALLLGAVLGQESINLGCEGDSVVATIPDDSNYSLLKAALQYSGMTEEELNLQAGFTLFAPTNQALSQVFDNFGEKGLAHFSPQFVREILLTHIVLGQQLTSQAISNLPDDELVDIQTALSDLLQVGQVPEGNQEQIADLQADCQPDAGILSLVVEPVNELEFDLITVGSEITNPIPVVESDVQICQGTLHGINGVLIPNCNVSKRDVQASAPSVERLREIDEGLVPAPALGIGSLPPGPITAPAINDNQLELPAPGPGPMASTRGVEFEAPTPGALFPGALLGPAPLLGPALAPAPVGADTRDVVLGDVPVGAPGAPGVGPTGADVRDTEVVEPPPMVEPPPLEEQYDAAREGIANIAPGPDADFFGAAVPTNYGPQGALTDVAARDLGQEPGFELTDPPTPGPAYLCIQLDTLEDVTPNMERLDEATGGLITRFVSFLGRPSSDDIKELLVDPDQRATVFIPINKGIAALPEDTYTGPANNDFLRYHIVTDFNDPATEFAAEPTQVEFETALENDDCETTVQVDVPEAGEVEVNGVSVSDADLVSCDGRIRFHIIEGALNPQCNSEELETAIADTVEVQRENRADAPEEESGMRDLGFGTGPAPAPGPDALSGAVRGADTPAPEPDSASTVMVGLTTFIAMVVAFLL